MSNPDVKDEAGDRAMLIAPAYGNTDDASPELVLRAVLGCALSWQPEVRLLGNVRAGDVVRAIQAILGTALQHSHETMRAEMRRDEVTRKPTWFCSESDGRGEISELEVVELAAELFPEGTFVRITEPAVTQEVPHV